jgi:hypothetical protein
MFMNTNGLQLYIGYSLVDITATGVTRGQDSLERNQQRNWETVLQCIGLRAQPHNIQLPEENFCENMKVFQFGDFYNDRPQKFWSWVWSIESQEVYDLPNRPLGGLLQDLEQVPIITGLTETARFMLPIFYPYGAIKNIYIERYIG